MSLDATPYDIRAAIEQVHFRQYCEQWKQECGTVSCCVNSCNIKHIIRLLGGFVQFINLFLELILSVCDHYHDPTSSPAYSSNVSVLFPLAPHPFTIHLGFLSVYLGVGLPARTFFYISVGV